MLIGLTRKQVAEINEALKAILDMTEATPDGNGSRVKTWPVFFEYMVTRNLKLLELTFKALAEKQRDLLKPFHLERMEMNKNLALKNEQGEPIIENGVYKLPEGVNYETHLKALETKHDKEIKEWEAYIAETVSVEVHVIDFEKVQDLVLPAGALSLIMPLLKS